MKLWMPAFGSDLNIFMKVYVNAAFTCNISLHSSCKEYYEHRLSCVFDFLFNIKVPFSQMYLCVLCCVHASLPMSTQNQNMKTNNSWKHWKEYKTHRVTLTLPFLNKTHTHNHRQKGKEYFLSRTSCQERQTIVIWNCNSQSMILFSWIS